MTAEELHQHWRTYDPETIIETRQLVQCPQNIHVLFMQPPDGCGVSSERDESDFIFTSPQNEENKMHDGQSERNRIHAEDIKLVFKRLHQKYSVSDASILRVSRLAVL